MSGTALAALEERLCPCGHLRRDCAPVGIYVSPPQSFMVDVLGQAEIGYRVMQMCMQNVICTSTTSYCCTAAARSLILPRIQPVVVVCMAWETSLSNQILHLKESSHENLQGWIQF